MSLADNPAAPLPDIVTAMSQSRFSGLMWHGSEIQKHILRTDIKVLTALCDGH